MSHRANKIRISLFFFLTLVVVGCIKRNKIHKYNAQEMQQIREDCYHHAIKIFGEKEYWDLYNQANDSINNWIQHNLKDYALQRENWWSLDSIVCINKEKNKCRMAIMNGIVPDGNTYPDVIEYFYGVKISNHWYFFNGPSLILPREYYQEDQYSPLSFEIMKQIAASNIYRGYLKKGKSGEWEINEDFFSDLTSVAWCTDCFTQDDWDNKYLSIIRKNWEKK